MLFFSGRSLFLLVTAGILGVVYRPTLKAQPVTFPNRVFDQQVARAERYLTAFKNDSAVTLTGSLLKELKAQGQFDTPLGIRVQLDEANAYEQDQQGELALQKTLLVQQKSQQSGLWEIHAKACLVLALIYEKIQLNERSRQQLDLAKADIDRYGLARVYPYFAIRRSSWERIYGNQKAALFFAHEALRTAPKHGLILEEAISHMLLNGILPKSSANERLYHSLRAVRLYQQVGDYTGLSIMLGAISSIYRQRNDFRRALAYNDSNVTAANRVITGGNHHNLAPMWAYRSRAQIYEQMGVLDSALVNWRKAHQLELAYNEEDVKEKIIEVESRYQNKNKQHQIDQQQLALRLKDNQLRFSFIIVGLVLVSAAGLWLAYRRQRQAKQKLLGQNLLIQQQASQLKQLDAAKSRFFANVSHELRTPLTLLLGPIGTLLTENQLTDKQAHLLQLAGQSGRQLDQLVTDLLDLNKLELGKLELEQKPTRVAAFFRAHLAQFESLVLSRHLHYDFDTAVADEVVANLDQAKCRQILNNLLANAIKFTLAGGHITASLTLTDGRLQLRVADTGSGIHPDDLPYLFDRYFQTNRPHKPAEGGMGIGLALCQEYTRLMGGTIEVDSTPGVGSVFRVVWPVVLLPSETVTDDQVLLPIIPAPSTPADQSPVAPATAQQPYPRRPTILVVEDNPDLQTYTRLILSDKYRLVMAENGQVALDQLRKEGQGPTGISLILSDIMMPVMDGHQLLEALKADEATRHLPVIMLTARADVRDKLRALRIGVDDYLLKPFEEVELLARIDNLLANQTARQQALAHEPQSDPMRPATISADPTWLEAFEGYVQQHLADPTLTVPELAHHFALSESSLLRQLKRLTGLSPVQYVQAVRLEEGRRLLESHTGQSVTQVAARVGYADARSFARSFRTRFGKLPSELLET